MVKTGLLLGDSKKKCKAVEIPVPKDEYMVPMSEGKSEAKNCAEFKSKPQSRIQG